jgi:hypothetical protein
MPKDILESSSHGARRKGALKPPLSVQAPSFSLALE